MVKYSYSTLILLGAALISSCSYGSRKNFQKIPQTSFLPHPIEYVGEPFDGEWRAPHHKAIMGDLYIRIAPALVSDPLSRADAQLLAVAKHLAHRFELKLKTEFAKLSPHRIFLVEEAPAGKTLLTIECALIDLHVTNSRANIVGGVAGMYVPGASLVTSTLDDGHVTFAAKVYADGELVTEFAECDTTPLSLLGSLNDFSEFGNQRAIIDQWAHSMAMDVKFFAEGKRVKGANRVQLFSSYTSD